MIGCSGPLSAGNRSIKQNQGCADAVIPAQIDIHIEIQVEIQVEIPVEIQIV